ncbi:uncharacterized protein LOC141784722 [Halichoeres trimaculatus]|uniref:uncharacterized protein LOC141784722 n=1 Tax=Halichoeres trimaculatus TaxID=147232 RepID=UPI003D9F94E0
MAPELLTVIMASGCCVAVGFVILMLVVLCHRRDPLCPRFRADSTEHYSDEEHPYHSRHTLIGLTHDEQRSAMTQGAAGPQLPGRLFIIGKPTDYYLTRDLPRLPSYESVRKKDHQREIHNMISQRFGLIGCPHEPPPTYEETFNQPAEVSPPHLQVAHLSVHSQGDSSQLDEDTQDSSQPPSVLQDPPSSSSSSSSSAPSSRFLSV